MIMRVHVVTCFDISRIVAVDESHDLLEVNEWNNLKDLRQSFHLLGSTCVLERSNDLYEKKNWVLFKYPA